MPVSPDPTAERAVALANASGGALDGLRQGADELAAAGDRAQLERARAELVTRIRQRSDDYEATAALSLVNRALATLGWPDPYSWKHRRKP
ncbi:MAG: hypothetical protein ACRDZX_11880 [Acidimicrobiales bacterium]